MSNQELITKAQKTLVRHDGSEVRITAEQCSGAGLTLSLMTMVHHRKDSNSPWNLCSDRPEPGWKSMPVDEYIREGRAEMLKVVSIGEILSVTSLIGLPLQG